MAGAVLVARDGEIATVTLSNPERFNALDLAMWERLGAHVRLTGPRSLLPEGIESIADEGEGSVSRAASFAEALEGDEGVIAIDVPDEDLLVDEGADASDTD